MTEPAGAPSIPLLGDIALTAVQSLAHDLETGFRGVPVVGLAGEAQQQVGRGSHLIRITGLLHGDSVADDLATLQQAAAEGTPLTFAADIVTALELQEVVISGFRAEAVAGRPRETAYAITLTESPPLPPPAEVSGFGGLDDFGLGDLGFDTDIMGDLADLAGDVAGAVGDALDVVGALDALSGLGDLGNVGGMLQPLEDSVNAITDAGGKFGDAVRTLGGLFS